ncbi:MAG: type III PLP-dependent enzyme, partial [Alphaproteobacteria bacterium]|nr:type III PLP-dependent enzyme [Alphaproteobacteria bacterium]
PVFSSVAEAVRVLKPARPVHVVLPKVLRAAAQMFLAQFPGTSYYAVKCNPHPFVLKTLFAAGVRFFDVASIAEITLVAEVCPGARMAFMHPVKSREAIREAYTTFGIRDFSLDCFEELHKIVEATSDHGVAATDLVLHVRVATPNAHAAQNLSAKFGCQPAEAVQLLQDANKVAHKVGLAFHVGSQSRDPAVFAHALALCGDLIKQSGVTLDVLDVGGGFPVAYQDDDVPALTQFFDVIREGLAKLALPKSCEVWCEPGRAMVGGGETLITRIELRKGDALYLNDGLYGSLFDAGYFNQKFPVEAMRLRRGWRADKMRGETLAYKLFGPTCDSIDVMPGPYHLPADLREGDYVLFTNHGAYGRAMSGNFNGFHEADTVVVE